MPIHDWTKVQSGLFHHFHQTWTPLIASALNQGVLPEGYFALVEQRARGPEPDVIAVETPGRPVNAMTAVLSKPKTKLSVTMSTEANAYAKKANRIVVRNPLGDVVAVIEVVSPGNKDTKAALHSFVEKSVAFLRFGIHLLVLDMFPPGKHDPQGVHQAISDEFWNNPYYLPKDKPLTFVSYQAGTDPTAYIEPLAFGDPLPEMPLFLTEQGHILVPLEASYQAAWDVCPKPIQEMIEASS
jgi:hypothetical protein